MQDLLPVVFRLQPLLLVCLNAVYAAFQYALSLLNAHRLRHLLPESFEPLVYLLVLGVVLGGVGNVSTGGGAYLCPKPRALIDKRGDLALAPVLEPVQLRQAVDVLTPEQVAVVYEAVQPANLLAQKPVHPGIGT
jgi:hypothetical protein